jgi:hypothetical protein
MYVYNPSGLYEAKLDIAGSPPRVVDLMTSETNLFSDGC